MKYGARAIVWGHKVIKGKVEYTDIPIKLKDRIDKYLTDHDYEFPNNDDNDDNDDENTEPEFDEPR